MNLSDYLQSILLLFLCIIALTGYILVKNQLQKQNEFSQILREHNDLTIIYLMNSLRLQLKSKDNHKLYRQLYRIKQTYKVPDIDKANSPEDMETLQQEKEQLQDYLSLLNMCGLLMRNGHITRDQVFSIIGDRAEDIKSHKELYQEIRKNRWIYRDLWWLLR